MSTKETGARRRAFTLFSALVIAASLAALSSGAGATSKCDEVLGTSTFSDATGDGSGTNAPDISDVTVTTYDGGTTALQIALPGLESFAADTLVRTYIDSDKNATTGNANGYEYMIQTTPPKTESPSGGDTGDGGDGSELTAKCEDQPASTLYAWDGSAWVVQDTETLSSWYGDSSLNVSLNASEVGNALSFNFALYAASNVGYDESGVPDISAASFDWAPDTGSWTYKPFELSTYNDPAGDGSAEGAPDITSVGVTKWKADQLKFAIAIPGTGEFGEDMLVRVMIDSDSNATTGDANGFDYMIQAQRASFAEDSALIGAKGVLHALCDQPNVRLLKWDGGSWSAVEGGSLDWWYSKGLGLSLDSSAIGGPAAFNFAVYAATKVSFTDSGSPDTTAAAFDRAPDAGSFAFPLAVSSAELVGNFKVTSKIIKSAGLLKQKKKTSKNVWSFQKSCAKTKCSTKLSMKGQGKYKLSRAGKTSYKVRTGGKKVSCAGSSAVRTTQTFSMKVRSGAWVKGKWRVTKWVGTLKISAKKKGCGAGSATSALTGTLKK